MVWAFCIRRPVLTVVVFLIIAIFGLYGYTQIPVRENPDIEFPIVSVNVVLAGAEPEVIETEIIDPLEERINTIEGLKELRSTAREEVATVTAEFELWRDIDIAAQDVRDRIDRARRDLPDDIEEPIVRKLDPDAQPIMWVAMTGDERWDVVRLSTYADEVLKDRLENLRGVGQILVGGQQLFAVRVQLDPDRLAAHRVTVQDVVRTIQQNNVKIPSGRVESQQREFLVKTEGQFAGPEPLNDLIIVDRGGAPVRIRDVGRAVGGVENDRRTARFLRQPAVGLGVVKQRGANTVQLANSVRRRMAELEKDFPPGLRYTIATDDSTYIEQSVDDLLVTIVLTTGLVALVVLGFLRSLLGTLIAAVAIPTSLLGGLALIYTFGFSLNVLTLLGLILSIGIVIDDAVVVLESTHRHLAQDEDRPQAARAGAGEVAFPNLANTLALAAVFVPVAFTAGLISRFFFEFSLTVAVTVFASTFTALTLTPMLCSRFLGQAKTESRLDRWTQKILDANQALYAWTLERAFNHRILTVLLAIAMAGLMVLFYVRLATEFQPPIDRSEFMIRFETPEGSTLPFTDGYARQVEAVVDDVPEVDRFFMAIGLSRGAGPGKVNEGFMFVHLIGRGQRQRSQNEIMQELRGKLESIPDGRAYVMNTATTIGGRGAELQVVLQHPDIDRLAERQETILAWMRAEPEYVGADSDLKMNKPQIEVTILRDKASQMGVSVAEISNTMRYLLGEPDVSEIERGNERYEVIPEITAKGEMIPARLGRLYVRTDTGRLVSLRNLVVYEESVGPSEIHRFNRLRSATLSASNPPDVALGSALDKLQDYFDRTLPEGFQHTVTGRAKDFRESFYYLTIALIFSVIFVYLVLSGQFESFLQPFVILLTLPLAGVGAFAALWALGMTLNIFSFIGLIMLVGMATKNAILMVDYTNRLLAEGERDLIESTKEAARVRFRPVIMTTLSTVLGMMPIALGYGAGGEARAPLGVAVASGLMATTLLTLIVIPVVFTLVEQARRRVVRALSGRERRQSSDG